MDIVEYTNCIYNKLNERINDNILDIKNELSEYIDKKFFNIKENIDEFINNKCKKIDDIIAKKSNKDIINYPDYIIGNNNSIINSNINIYIPKKIDIRYKIENIIYIPYSEITELSNVISFYNQYLEKKIENKYLENIENIIILSDPLIYISLLKSYLSIDKYINLTYNMNSMQINRA